MATFKLFDFINDINSGKKNLLRTEEFAHNDYSPWIINIGMSLYPDTVLYANDVNQFFDLSKQIQYDYYIHSIRKSKRFAKWPKQLKITEDIKIISKIFNINISRAREYIELIDENKKNDIINKYTNYGGSL